MTRLSLNVNGSDITVEVENRTLLAHVLREQLSLTGTHIGCDTSQCGACVVHVDGSSVKSCTMLAVQAEGMHVTTVEGITPSEDMHPLQTAFRENHGLQCGYCTPGMMMSTLDLVSKNSTPTDADVREWLEGNLCRCTGYYGIVNAVQAYAKTLKEGT